MKGLDKKAKIMHPQAWVWEPLEQEPSFLLRSMFGAKSIYLHGRIVLCCCHGEEPWNGILLCTDKSHHASLKNEFPSLIEHPVLGKWLYLSERHGDFERIVGQIVKAIITRDPRIGVIGKPKRNSMAKGTWLSK